mmetsp:Transcript_17054/g.28524  ORF Transcript_17054/g.28524 Transcript_17054/m.28524 type:complete len:123 (-) Transcript_17054:1025-1393(-)
MYSSAGPMPLSPETSPGFAVAIMAVGAWEAKAGGHGAEVVAYRAEVEGLVGTAAVAGQGVGEEVEMEGAAARVGLAADDSAELVATVEEEELAVREVAGKASVASDEVFDSLRRLDAVLMLC